MFELKRAPRITHQVKLGNEVLDISINIAEVTRDLLKQQGDLAAAEKAMKTNPNEAKLEAYGAAVTKLLRLVFGEDGTAKVLAFYEDNYIEMVTEVMPFIYEVVFPAMQDQKNKVAAMYKDRKK